jgi:hypothetical protein
MKLILALIALLVPWTTLLAKPAATLWTGKCVNKTANTSGQVKLILFEPSEPDEKGVRKVSGYMSVTGWLSGGGEFEGTISKGDLAFNTRHLAPIQWSGSFGLDSIVGSYSIPAQGDMPAQAGEFVVDKVNRNGAADEFRQNLMVVFESDFNSIEVGADGKGKFWPQVIFDAIHPVGTGVSIQVADLDIEWQEGADRTSTTGIRRYTTEYFLFWSSPLQPKGVTRLRTVHNAELGEMIACDVIATNGTTKEDVKETAKDVGVSIGIAVGAALLKSLIESGGK